MRRLLTCPYCEATFNTNSNVRNHIKSHKPRKCQYCGEHIYRTAKHSASTIHRAHEISCQRKITRELMPKKGVKTYRCVTCFTDFNRHSHFERHSCFMECIHCKEKIIIANEWTKNQKKIDKPIDGHVDRYTQHSINEKYIIEIWKGDFWKLLL